MEDSSNQQKKNLLAQKREIQDNDSSDDMDQEKEMDEEDNNLDFAKVDKEKQIMDGEQEDQGEWQEDADGQANVEVDFSFFDPNPNHFHAVKNLVNTYLDGASFKSSELTDIIVNQVELGTMVGIEDVETQLQEQRRVAMKKEKESSILGFVTILNPNFHQEKPVIHQIMNFLVDKSLKNSSDTNHTQFLEIIGKTNFGLLVNERIINLTPMIAPLLHDQLSQDLQWIFQQTDIDNKVFQFDYLIVLTQLYKQNSQNPKEQKQKGNLQQFIYAKFEDFCFLEKSELYFQWEAHTSQNSGGITNVEKDFNNEICIRTVYVIKTEEYVQTIPSLNDQIDR